MTDWASHFQRLSAETSRAAREAFEEQESARFGASVGDVLAYRTLWNDYVMGTVKALSLCADAWNAAGAAKRGGQSLPTGPNYGVLSEAAQAAPESYEAIGSTDQGFANDLLASWNMHAGMSEHDILLQASNILQDFQNTVLRVGQFYQPQVQNDCPSVPLPSPPSQDSQKQVISQLQGAGIAAQGALQLLGIGASGGLQTVGSVITGGIVPLPEAVQEALKKTASTWLPSKTTLIVGGIGALVGLVLIAKIVK